MAETEPIVHDVQLGRTLVRLRFASSALTKAVLPALMHLRATRTTGRPHLTVALWDAAGGLGLPPPFWGRGPRAPARGEIRAYADVGVYAHFQSGVHPRDGRFTAATFFDENARLAHAFVVDAKEIPWFERAAPLRTVFQWAFTPPDRLLVHAGALDVEGRGVLLAGPSGAGKSTSAVAAVLAGHRFVGDDYVLVELDRGEALVHSLYATAKLHPAATQLLTELPARYRRPLPRDVSKHVIDIGKLHPDRLGGGVRITSIVIPEVRVGGGTRVCPAPASAALMALAPTTVLQAPRNDGGALSPLARLVRQVPAYRLELDGPDGVADALLTAVYGR